MNNENLDPRIIELFEKAGIGTGDDPIGFLLSSLVYSQHLNKEFEDSNLQLTEQLDKLQDLVVGLEKERDDALSKISSYENVAQSIIELGNLLKESKTDDEDPSSRIQLSDGTIVDGEIADVYESLVTTIISISDVAESIALSND